MKTTVITAIVALIVMAILQISLIGNHVMAANIGTIILLGIVVCRVYRQSEEEAEEIARL